MWSTWSRPTRIATASPMVAGSAPYSWIDRGDSSSANTARDQVLALSSTRPRAVIISLT